MPHHPDLPPPNRHEPPEPSPTPGSAEYTAATVACLCGFIRLDGLSERRAALLAGLTPEMLRAWKDLYPLLRPQLEQARAEFQQTRIARIREAAGRGGEVDWRAQAYLLEKAHLDIAAETGAEETASESADLPPPFILQPEHLAALQQRRLAALAKSKP